MGVQIDLISVYNRLIEFRSITILKRTEVLVMNTGVCFMCSLLVLETKRKTEAFSKYAP